MILDGRSIFLLICFLLAAGLPDINGEQARKSRSIKNNVYHQLLQDPNYKYMITKEGHIDRISNDVIVRNENEDSEESRDAEEKLFAVIVTKDYRVSTASDLEKFDRIGERMIDRANITEDAKRVVRQVKKQKPGFFWTLARVAFETVNETRSAIAQISNIVENSISAETTTVQGSTTVQGFETTSDDSNSTTTTTEAPFRLTVSGLQGIVRRNLRGLVRLFNIEWQDALNQSQRTVKEFQRDLGNQISPFLQDNPNVV